MSISRATGHGGGASGTSRAGVPRAAGRREAVYGDDAAGRVGGATVGCARKRFELFCDERMGAYGYLSYI